MLQWRPHTICTFFSMNKVYTNATSQYEGYITYSLQTKSWLQRPFGKHPGCKRGIILHKINGDNSAFLLLVLPCAKKTTNRSCGKRLITLSVNGSVRTLDNRCQEKQLDGTISSMCMLGGQRDFRVGSEEWTSERQKQKYKRLCEWMSLSLALRNYSYNS